MLTQVDGAAGRVGRRAPSIMRRSDVTAPECVQAVLLHVPEGGRVVVSLDCDGLDPGIVPRVMARTSGGLTYTQVTELIAGAGRRARIAGFDLVELYPPTDIDGMSAQTAARLLVNVIGAVVRQV